MNYIYWPGSHHFTFQQQSFPIRQSQLNITTTYTMKSSILNLLVGITAVAAAPSEYSNLEARQGGVVANDLKNGDCKAVTFIMARGSTETSNMVRRYSFQNSDEAG